MTDYLSFVSFFDPYCFVKIKKKNVQADCSECWCKSYCKAWFYASLLGKKKEGSLFFVLINFNKQTILKKNQKKMS